MNDKRRSDTLRFMFKNIDLMDYKETLFLFLLFLFKIEMVHTLNGPEYKCNVFSFVCNLECILGMYSKGLFF